MASASQPSTPQEPTHADEKPELYGLAAIFDSPEAILEAAGKVHAAGYRRAEGYTPFAVEGLSDALGFKHTGVPLIVLVGGAFGAIGGYFMLWYANVISYPWNVGGKPPNSWPAFIPITFEMTVLGASLLALFGMLLLNGLPSPYHPMFHAPRFDRASQTEFFLCIESADAQFDPARTRAFLEGLNPLAIVEVPW
ncbi:MAG TPA: DUF3341 domain-containing protein [Tepidisphaeraceae bacterium]|nr:DUF3341 domain-containing protein [Tepidisphaeraceae bacterium]